MKERTRRYLDGILPVIISEYGGVAIEGRDWGCNGKVKDGPFNSTPAACQRFLLTKSSGYT